MIDKETLKKEYRQMYNDWSDEEVEEYATLMANKYSTIKKGSNVIHLEYYHGLINDTDIKEIEANIAQVGLELSRFDKNGVPYSSLQDFSLQIAIFLGDPVVQNILLGLGTNALWDAIKKSTFLIWTRLKSRLWSVPKNERKSNLNFGLKVRLDSNTTLDLKLDGEVDDQTTLQALDKVIDLLKSTTSNDRPRREKFFIYNAETNSWLELDVMEELRKMAIKKSQE